MTLLPYLNRHLTEEQFFLLLDSPGQVSETVARAHLRSCGRCQSEFAAIQSSLSDFRVSTTNLAAASMDATPLPATEPPPALRFGPRGMALSFATAVLAIGATIPFMHPPKTSSAPATGSRPHPISADPDEALLEGINRDLATSIPPSLEPLAPRAENSGTAH